MRDGHRIGVINLVQAILPIKIHILLGHKNPGRNDNNINEIR